MDDLNSVNLVGRLTKDAELKYTNAGTALVKFSLAQSSSVKRGESWEKKTAYFEITFWGKRAEGLAKYLAKGQQVAISGKLDFEQWEQDGQRRSKITVKSDDVQLLGSAGGKQKPDDSAPEPSSTFEDDVPF